MCNVPRDRNLVILIFRVGPYSEGEGEGEGKKGGYVVSRLP